MAFSVQGLIKRAKEARDELQKSEVERAAAEQRAEAAEKKAERNQQQKKTAKERALAAAGAGTSVLSAGAAAMVQRKIRQKVNIVPKGIDLGGVSAVLGFIGAVLVGARKRADPLSTGAVSGAASGLAAEYLLHRMNPVAPQASNTTTSGLEDEEAGALEGGPRRPSIKEKLMQSRRDTIDARDVIDMPTDGT